MGSVLPEAPVIEPPGTCVVSCVGLTKVVARGTPLTMMTLPGMKFEPFAVRTKAGLLGSAPAG